MAKAKDQQQGQGGQVVNIAKVTCCAEGCKKPDQKAGFCSEHYVWFKEGLLNKKGQKPKDFDRKFQLFSSRRAA